MFEMNDIEDIYKRAAEKNWPYHYLFNSLKALGMERYEVNVLTHETKYIGQGQWRTNHSPEGFVPHKAGETFQLDLLKQAIERVQKREISYEDFLRDIAAAGVTFYRVDMKPRTVTYHGPDGNKYVEKVQE